MSGSAPPDRFEALLAFYEQRGYHHRLGAGERPAVLVVDFSRAFTEGDSVFPGGDFRREMAQTLRLLEAARGAFPVFFTTLAYGPDMKDAGWWATKVPWLRACQAATRWVEIDPALGVRPEETVIVKKFPSAFHGTDLDARLAAHGIDTLIVAGCTTSVCVRATVVDALQHGYRPLVAAEAVGDFVPEVHQIHLLDLDARYADVLGVEDVLGYLRQTRARPAAPGFTPRTLPTENRR
jgi:maleamate amidohydrolase